MKVTKIRNVEFKSPAFLAPMAGVSDRAYRELCRQFGAGYCVSEMVSSKALSFNNKKSEELMEISESERPCGIQIFGGEPECMALAAKSAMKQNPDIIDINMGVSRPENQLCRKRSGTYEKSAALRRDCKCRSKSK